LDKLERALSDPDQGIRAAPVDLAVAIRIRDVARDVVPDMPDRIIGATALHLGLQLVSRGQALRRSQIPVIW
jgi:predicted nucleic acid-binding protein